MRAGPTLRPAVRAADRAPAVRRARPHRAGTRLAGGALLVVAALAGCEAGGSAQQIIDRARLVNDLAARLDRAGQLTYTAEYQLPGGEAATIAQAQPPRTAYTYPGGKLVVQPDTIAECRTDGGAAVCTVTPRPSPGVEPPQRVLRGGGRGIVPPTTVVGLLTAASLDSNAVIAQHDTTIAGEHATCVDVSGVENAAASNFTACITSNGVLGEFRGTVSGVPVELTLTRLVGTVTGDAFALPAGAQVNDRRPGG
jgi:hypothetical protein